MTDVLYQHIDAIDRVQLPAPTWPTIEALAATQQMSWRDTNPLLPRYTPVTAAGHQTAEKEPLPGTPIRVEYVDTTMQTVGNTVDVSLQARRHAGGEQPFADILVAATARQANSDVLAALEAAAGPPLTGISAAIAQVAQFGGPILIISSKVEGANDLATFTASSGGRIRIMFDPDAGSTLAVAKVGVALQVEGVNTLTGLVPSILGQDLATYATIIGPVISPGAVAKGEYTGTTALLWEDV